MTVLEQFQHDLSQICTAKQHEGYESITTPYSTLSSKFVSVFVLRNPAGGYMVSDGGWLVDDFYEVFGTGDMARYLRFQTENTAIYEHEKEFYMDCDRNLLTSAIVDMAQFIQLSVNLAYLKQD